MKKRILSILLTLCMVLMLVPATVFAEGAGGSYTLMAGTNGAGDNEGPGSLIDGSSDTKWCVTSFSSAYIIFETSSAVNVSGYSITTGNDNAESPGRNPKNWTLYGCNDESAGRNSTSWVPIHSVTNDTVLKDVNKQKFNFVFDKENTTYQYYKLEITAIQSGDVMQMSEFALIDCSHSWTSKTVAPTCKEQGYTAKICTICNSIKEKTDYTAVVGHDYSGADGACIFCGYKQSDFEHIYDISSGNVVITDDETNAGKIKVSYGSGQSVENIDHSQTITVTGSTTASSTSSYELKVETAKHVTIRAKDLSIDSSKRDNAYAMVLIGGGTSEQKSADVTLILEGENTFKGGWGIAGITVGPGKKLTIEGSGTVTAIGGDKAAGIGGEYNNNCGEIIINSGTVIAKGRQGGSMGAAGIGGGYNGNGGNITINGGSVTATSDGYGAGIGGGDNGGNGGNITINGGSVNATSWTHGAGIGGGLGGSGGNITINGGYVTAKSIDCGAGIGGGRVGHGGDIIINGGTVTAISNSGAGIGDGEAAQNSSGTFSTAKDGKSGNAVIFAKSISDQIGKNNNLWSGIIFEGNSGKVYGTSVTPTDDFTIEKGKTLTIDNGKLLIISEDVTMVNAGTINNNGKIYVDGTFTGTADNLYYPLTLVKATATENTSVYNTKTYGKAGSEITLTPDTPPTGYAFDKWEASPASVTIGNDNKFTMPNKAITVAAQYKDIAAPVISGVEDGKTYCSAQTVTVSDNDAIDRVTVNGTEVTLDERNQFTLSPANGTQEIIATDKAGNRKTVTVAINDGHTDVNTDHACDYCDTNVGTHADTNRDHKCDYGCSVAIGVHEDTNNDHKCDYGCSEAIGVHADTNSDHKCDYGCSEAIGVHVDTNNDHKCDYGCSEAIGVHADTNNDHKCDYGCSEAIGVHADTNNDHNCDYCHEQMTTCKDDNKDHLCDICCATLTECKDENPIDHKCDICGATLSQHSGGTATCTNKATCDICDEPYGELDSTNHNLEHIPAKKATVTQEGNIEYWHCKDCEKYFSDKDGKKTIELKDTVIAKLPAENEQSCFAPLMLKATSPKDKTVKLTWTKLKGVKGYIVYGVRCGNDLKKIKTVKGNSYTIKNLKKGKYYKYMVVAYKTVNGKQVTISNSKVAHVAVKGGKYGNATKITVNKINPIKSGKKLTLKATVKYSKKNVKTHVPIRYESTNTKIAKVNSKGVITAKAKGVCYVYVYAQNGVYKQVKVTVK
ncbi:MAG: hypothetical protein ACI4HZ_09610 [Ruminococcus sp.]